MEVGEFITCLIELFDTPDSSPISSPRYRFLESVDWRVAKMADKVVTETVRERVTYSVVFPIDRHMQRQFHHLWRHVRIRP